MEQLIARLQQARLDIGDEDIADAIWLALQMASVSTVPPPTPVQESPPSPHLPNSLTPPSPETEPLSASQPALGPSDQPPPLSVFPEDALSQSLEDSGSPRSSQGLPFQAPAAAALPNALELGRSLKPLMRKVPSPRFSELDEEATVNAIIEQDLWQPVLKPAPERWLDLELVVEASPLSEIWQRTIADLQHKVLEHQGAFRNVRAWTLNGTPGGKPQLRPSGNGSSPGTPPQALVHPSRRRLIWVISDCRSQLWQQPPPASSRLSDNLYSWLHHWAAHGPTALIQLLPPWLWQQSALGAGFQGQLRSLFPGEANPQLLVEGLSNRNRRRAQLDTALKLPVVTLDPHSFAQGCGVIAGAGLVKVPGVIFNLALLARHSPDPKGMPPRTEPTLAPEAQAAAVVDGFLATASPKAQELAGMMAAVPVSLPVVHLLQSRLIRNPSPVEIAEVYMGGLLESQGTSATGQALYEFKPGVRRLLTQAMPRYVTEQVIQTLSAAIAEKLGIAIDSFAAFLAPQSEWLEQDRTVARFAEILPEVLRNLGEDYQLLVESAELLQRLPSPEALRSQRTVTFPELQVLAFETAQLIPAEAAFEAEAEETVEAEEADNTEAKLDPAALEEWTIPPLDTEEVTVVTLDPTPELPLEEFTFEIVTLELTADTSLDGDAPFLDLQPFQFEYIALPVEQSSSQNAATGMNLGAGWSTSALDAAEIADMLQSMETVQPKGPVKRGRRKPAIFKGEGQQFVERLDNDPAVFGFDRLILEMVEIPAGKFIMGSPPDELERKASEGPLRGVAVPKFFLGKHAVTQAQWRFAAGLPQINVRLPRTPSRFSGRNHPVEHISWDEAIEFCSRLSVYTGRNYRLPSEAEWEYACRAGTLTPFYSGENITTNWANYNGDYFYGDGATGVNREETTPVGSFPANRWGLYDMHGNVYEWCQDLWHKNYDGAPNDGSAWLTGESHERVLRGGSWYLYPSYCRSAFRFRLARDRKGSFYGLRVACSDLTPQ